MSSPSRSRSVKPSGPWISSQPFSPGEILHRAHQRRGEPRGRPQSPAGKSACGWSATFRWPYGSESRPHGRRFCRPAARESISRRSIQTRDSSSGSSPPDRPPPAAGCTEERPCTGDWESSRSASDHPSSSPLESLSYSDRPMYEINAPIRAYYNTKRSALQINCRFRPTRRPEANAHARPGSRSRT